MHNANGNSRLARRQLLSQLGTVVACGWLASKGFAEEASSVVDKATIPSEKAESSIKPGPVEDVPVEQLDAAILKGIKFLLADQNKDGSWGSAEKTKGLNIYAPVPGSHHAFRGATSALCLSALNDVSARPNLNIDGVAAAIERGQNWLLEKLATLRRANGDAIYNVWGHAFGMEALVKLHDRSPNNEELRTKIKQEIAHQIDFLTRYETVNGGWGYYDFDFRTRKPAGDPASFTTATGLLALLDARSIGVEVPQKLLDRGKAAIERMTRPDYSYIYGEYLKYTPQHPVNQPGGSLGRTQVCFLAMRKLGDEHITDDRIREWLGRLIVRNGWLSMGRKRPIPHESWFAVAGYFYYYGHYYAAKIVYELPPQDRAFFKNHLARIILPLQEADGSWWDYPLYNYHQQYGTAMAITTLHLCRVEPPSP